MTTTFSKFVKSSVIGLFALITIIGQTSYALDSRSFVPPLQRNPYNTPNYVARGASGSLSVRNPQNGQYMSRYVPYYSAGLYQAMKIRSVDKNMRAVLKSILTNSHIAQPGQLDKIVQRCPTGDKNCYAQVSVGYERARLFLMGYFYLVKVGSQYAIKEAYCNKLYGADEFRGKGMPRPEFIPDNTVINVEHTWPQSKFTGRYPADIQKADLHHLYPTDSKLNAIRGNYPFGEVVKDSASLKCGQSRFGMSESIHGPTFEPPDNHKGHVARALFYFALRYDTQIPANEEATLRAWHKQFPVDAEELLRNDEIFKVQGNRNPFIDHPELVDSISDL